MKKVILMTVTKIAALLAIAAPVLAGGGYVAKLAGDKIWVDHETFPAKVEQIADEKYVPIGAYQQQKLYDLQDEAFEYELQEKYEGQLTPRDKEKLDRLLKRIERLEDQIAE